MIIDTTGHPRPLVIGEVDLFAAPVLVHDNAIYLHESRQYHVEHLDWEERKAYVKPVDVDYYTQALLAVTLKPLEIFAHAPAAAAERAHGEVMVIVDRHALQEAAARDAREHGLGQDPPARDRAAHDRVLGRAGAGASTRGGATSWTWHSPAPGGRCRRWRACC